MTKRWLIYPVVICLMFISACAPSVMPGEQGAVAEEATQAPMNNFTPLPVNEEATPLPTIGIITPQEEADMIFEKVRPMIAEKMRVSAEEIKLIEIEPVEWPDGCLGLASPDEMCIQVITPGYRLLVEVNGNTLEVRTDQNGHQVRINREIGLPDVRESERSVPARCRQEGLNRYVDFTDGFCFAYPSDFILDPNGLAAVIAQPKNLSDPAELTVRLDIVSGPALSDAPLEELVAEFRKQVEKDNPSRQLRQSEIRLDGETALVVEPLPGRADSRIVFALHNGFFYQLIFSPIDEPSVEPDLNRLYETVISTFTFIP